MGADPLLADGNTFRARIPDALGVLSGAQVRPRTRPDADGAILALADSVESFTLGQAAEAAGLTKRSASAHVSSLVAAGRLRAEGKTRDRRYRRV